MRHTSCILLGVLFALSGLIQTGGNPSFAIEPRPAVDVEEVLPSKAIARMGSTRYGFDRDVSAVGISTDGRLVGTADRVGTHVWDLRSGQKRATLTPRRDAAGKILDSFAFAIHFSPKNDFLATGMDKRIAVWNLSTGVIAATLEHDRFIPNFQFVDAKQLVFYDGFAAYLWNFATDKTTTLTEDRRQGAVVSIAVSPDGALFATGGLDGGVSLRRLSNAELVRSFPVGDRTFASALVFSADGRYLAVGEGSHAADSETKHEINVWEITTGERFSKLSGHAYQTDAIVFGPGHQLLVSVGGDRRVRVWVLRTQKLDAEFETNSPFRKSLALTRTTNQLLACARVEGIHCWNLAEKKEILPDEPYLGCITQALISSDGSILVTESYEDQTLRAWNMNPIKPIWCVRDELVGAVALSPNARIVGIAGIKTEKPDRGGTIKLRNVIDGSLVAEATFKGWPTSAAFSPDGSEFISASWERDKIMAVSAKSGQPLREFAGLRPSGPGGFVVSPDGKKLAIADRAGDVKTFALPDGKPIGTTSSRKGGVPISDLTLSPDLVKIALIADHALSVQDLVTRKTLLALDPGVGGISAVAFSPDGNKVAVGSASGQVAILDLSGNELFKASGHRSPVGALVFHPKLPRLISCGKTIIVWGFDTK